MFTSSVPSFWLGLLLMQVFSVKLGWLPVAGYGGPDASLATRLSHPAGGGAGPGELGADHPLSSAPACWTCCATTTCAPPAGLPEGQVILKHAVRNALIPILTVLGLTTALLISGAVVTETVFGLPGVGSLVVSAVLRRDYPVIQGAADHRGDLRADQSVHRPAVLLVDPASAIDGGPPRWAHRSAARFPSRGMPADRQSRLRGIPMGCILVRCRHASRLEH